ncbi:MAG: glycosyl hydrolase, partial [Clostridia bacterium]|nr:glycosyl hydrolase [Clostridia bacterium]
MKTDFEVCVDLAKESGVIKPMNCVNNGPTGSEVRGVIGNFNTYKALEIPYARTHDSSFYPEYGWEFSIDVHRIFRDFDADENDPASYKFTSTDRYLDSMRRAGTEPFYRLGCNIEHEEKNGTYPPKDFAKWARICEHIIRHFNEGWANGFDWNITYWEIWNEPDCRNADGTNPCWQGTDEQFCELFMTAAKHLKSCFPALKIGGPAVCTVWNGDYLKNFLMYQKANKTPIDFISYHWYGAHLSDLRSSIRRANSLLAECGYGEAETILNEWNYIRGWLGDTWSYSLRTERNQKGAAFIAGAMCVGQTEDLDMLMYYDASPCIMDGLFDMGTLEPLPGYYALLAFRELRRLGHFVPTEIDYENGIYSCAARS